jgi:flagellin-like hook-associated protein FlgL
MKIQTNLISINAHRNLGLNSNIVMNKQGKLSSGLKINSAADDAAGLAISEKMRAQIRGLNQAARNAQDGVSLIQTAEGALQEAQNILQRLRELSVQSANDTNAVSDRGALDMEYQSVLSELDAIAHNTIFNEKPLLNGDLSESKDNSDSFPSVPETLVLPSIPIGTEVSPGDLNTGGSTDWSNINGKNLTWLRDKIVNEIAPSAISDILNSLDSLGFLKGTDIGVGLYHAQLGNANGMLRSKVGGTWLGPEEGWIYNALHLAIGLDDDLLSAAANSTPGEFTGEYEKRLLYEVLGHELAHAVMNVVVSKGFQSGERFPSWYMEGMAQALTGPGSWLQTLSGTPDDAAIKKYLSTKGDYGTGYFATLYLGYKAAGGGDVNAETILSGLNKIMGDNAKGDSLNQAFMKYVGKDTTAFYNEVKAGGAEIIAFVRDVMDIVGPIVNTSVAGYATGGGSLLGGLDSVNLNEWEVANAESFLRMDPVNSSVKNTYDEYIAISGGGTNTPGEPLNRPATVVPAPIISDIKMYLRQTSTGWFYLTFDTDKKRNEGFYSYLIVDKGAPAPDFDTMIDKLNPLEYIPLPTDPNDIDVEFEENDKGAKDVYIAVTDLAGNRSIAKFEVAAVPSFYLRPTPTDPVSLKPIRIDDATATVKFTAPNPPSGNYEYYYVVAEKGAAVPVIDTSGSGTPLIIGDWTTINLTGLTPGAKDFFVVAKNTATNEVCQTLKLEIPAGATPAPADTAKPVVTPGAAERLNDNNAMVKFTSNEAGKYYYKVVNKGEAAPVIDTSGEGISFVNAENTISINNIDAFEKDVYIAVKDAANNVSEPVIVRISGNSLPVLPTDTAAPTLSAVAANRTDEKNAEVKFNSSEAGEYFYAVVNKGETPVINTSAAGITCGAGEQTIYLEDLTAGEKDVYILMRDDAGNFSSQLKMGVAASVGGATGPDDPPVDPPIDPPVDPPVDPPDDQPTPNGNGLLLQTGANAGNTFKIYIESISVAKLGLSGAGVATRENAVASIGAVSDAIDFVSAQRAALGAYQNRLEYNMRSLEISSENLTNAESRIRDADMAKEMAGLVKHNILLESAQTMLAQANQMPQQVLQLLG